LRRFAQNLHHHAIARCNFQYETVEDDRGIAFEAAIVRIMKNVAASTVAE
jgi:hypothetical protein